MKRFGTKKIILTVRASTLIALVCIIVMCFLYSANLGYLVGDVFNDVDTLADEVYINAFTATQIDWEIAYWSAMICEYTYEKHLYPLENRALSKLEFTNVRKYSYYELDGEPQDDLMIDVGVKEVCLDGGSSFTLVVVAFRGSVPKALESPTSKENMRRNMQYAPKQWREVDVSVHGGFYDQYCDFLTDILPEINSALNLSIFKKNESISEQSMKFWIVGHSMGGALAELFTLDLIESGVEPENVMTYGFSTPLVGDSRLHEYATSIGASDRIYKIIHKQDMVGYIGYGLLWGKPLASNKNVIEFGNGGIFNRSHHSLPRIYLPFIASQNNQPKRHQFEQSLIIEDM